MKDDIVIIDISPRITLINSLKRDYAQHFKNSCYSINRHQVCGITCENCIIQKELALIESGEFFEYEGIVNPEQLIPKLKKLIALYGDIAVLDLMALLDLNMQVKATYEPTGESEYFFVINIIKQDYKWVGKKVVNQITFSFGEEKNETNHFISALTCSFTYK